MIPVFLFMCAIIASMIGAILSNAFFVGFGMGLCISGWIVILIDRENLV